MTSFEGVEGELLRHLTTAIGIYAIDTNIAFDNIALRYVLHINHNLLVTNAYLCGRTKRATRTMSLARSLRLASFQAGCS